MTYINCTSSLRCIVKAMASKIHKIKTKLNNAPNLRQSISNNKMKSLKLNRVKIVYHYIYGVQECPHVCMCMWNPVSDIESLFQFLSHSALRGVFQLNPQFSDATILASPLAMGISCVFLLSSGITGGQPCLPGIYQASEDPSSHTDMCTASTLCTGPLPATSSTFD